MFCDTIRRLLYFPENTNSMRRSLPMKSLAAIFFIIAFFPATASAANPREITVHTPDGWTLHGTYYPGRKGMPVILLMHKLGSDRSEFAGLARELSARGYNVAAYDARGHGESTQHGGRRETFESFSDRDFENMTIDEGAVLGYLRRNGAEKDVPVGLVGASIQSSTGLIYAAKHPEVKALVMLSPGLAYHNIDTTLPMKEYGKRPVFIAASREDTASYEAVGVLSRLAEGPKKVVILSDAGHGAQMFQKDPKLLTQVADWLGEYLK